MKAPTFWHGHTFGDHLLAAMLSPLSLAYRFGGWVRRIINPIYTPPLPTICIGNVTAGGAGKTPVTLALAAMLQEIGQTPHLIARGYRGSLVTADSPPLRVDLPVHTAHDVGDEPLIMAQHAPSWVARNRLQALYAAMDAGATVALCDDGLQNPGLPKSLSILVIDGMHGIGNGHVIPAGPCRESLKHALDKVSAVIIIGEDRRGLKKQIMATHPQTPVLSAHTRLSYPEELHIAPLVAFAGIGYPEKFFESLRSVDADLCETHTFADHHPYTESELRKLMGIAERHKAQLITTRKDWVRLPRFYQSLTHIGDITLQISEEDRKILGGLVEHAITEAT